MRHRPKRENYPGGKYGDIDYQERLERYCTYLENKLSKLRQPIVISSVCDCEKKAYDPLMSGEVKCLRCGKTIAQTDL